MTWGPASLSCQNYHALELLGIRLCRESACSSMFPQADIFTSTITVHPWHVLLVSPTLLA